jgi:hypothetical protein
VTNPLPDDVLDAGSVEDAAARLGEHLGLDGAAPLAATRRALDDPLYARALWSSRKLPELRSQLVAAAVAEAERARPPSSGVLAAKAAGSVLKWGMEGLRHAEPWRIQRRLAACARCEFRAPAPNTLIYRGAKVVAGKDAKICTACHCLINTKAALATERCPERDPSDPSVSRWGEPWVPPEEHPEGPW